MLQASMRGFVCLASVALGSLGLAACGTVKGEFEDGGTDTIECAAPPSWPSAKSYINLFATADGHSGPTDDCPKVGASLTTTNPQYVWCRRFGGLISGSKGFNHYWLWTDLDQGGDANGRGWISAYYIEGQGDDQANDINTGKPIPDCP